MKYLISTFVLIFSAITVTNLYAHTHRLHKNRFEIRQEQAAKAASIKLLQDNKFKDQMKILQALQEKMSTQRDPETRLKNMDRYISELQASIDVMQKIVNQYARESNNIVVTRSDNILPLHYRFTMMQQLIQVMTTLQEFMIDQLKDRERDIPSFKP